MGWANGPRAMPPMRWGRPLKRSNGSTTTAWAELDRLFAADVPSLVLAVAATSSRSSASPWTNCTTIRPPSLSAGPTTTASSGPSDALPVHRVQHLGTAHAYKRQPTIEKRFSQLKTDFEVAPVYSKAVHRIQAMLCMYFFALLVEALLERQLRQAMQTEEIDALPIYPEGRACRWPTARG